jgi:hypothetical protein
MDVATNKKIAALIYEHGKTYKKNVFLLRWSHKQVFLMLLFEIRIKLFEKILIPS